MGNTAKVIEPELTPEIEQWLRNKVAPLADAVEAGEIEGMPLMEAYELTMHNLTERRKCFFADVKTGLNSYRIAIA